MTIPSMAIGVCSWSLQVRSVEELRRLLDQLGINVVQIACGDPEHATWDEGDNFTTVARAAGFQMTGTMLGFAGEDYTSPESIQKTGGFGDPAFRAERLERLKWGLERTTALGLHDLTLHAGFIPEVGDPERLPFLETLARVSDCATAYGVTLGLETGQETAELLRRTLEDLKCPNLKVNFDPANMLLYDKGDPLKAVQLLREHLRSVHVKDATVPRRPGTWGEELPLGRGQVNIRQFVKTLQEIGFQGPLVIERGVGNQHQRIADVANGIHFLRECLVP